MLHNKEHIMYFIQMITHDSEQLLTWLVCARTGGFQTDHADRHGSAGAAVTRTVWQDETATLG